MKAAIAAAENSSYPQRAQDREAYMKNSTTVAPRYSMGEEIANSITHGIGVVFAIAGLAVMTAFASLYGDVWHIVACSVYGGSMILLYTASTLYHSIQWQSARPLLRVLDHCAIFLLIAGTYTPFTLVSLRGPWGWSLFGTIWGLAVAGILLEVFLTSRLRYLIIILYVAMGWVVIIAIKPMLAAVPTGGLVLLLAGGLCYTIGVPLYIKHSIPFNHAIWHLFVLAGTILHYFAVLLYVIPVLA
jgi:hemolysin III